MRLVQSRIVTDDVEGLAGFYARLLGVPVALNEYYVEIEAGRRRSASPSGASPNTARMTARPRPAAGSRARTTSSSISWSTTSTPSTRESPRSASNG